MTKIFALVTTLLEITSLSSFASPTCGKTKVELKAPEYLTTACCMLAVELPKGWKLDPTHKNPFPILKNGDSYDSAKTLMYINVESLTDPLQNAVKRDADGFKGHCPGAKVIDLAAPKILEEGCERVSQKFVCPRDKKAYTDIATKISLNGFLLNVVISAESAAEIEKYKNDYEFILNHLAKIK